MLYYQIKNYEDFKKRFGLTTRENGVISRKNKILLGHLKNPLLLRYCLTHNDYSLLHISDMADLRKISGISAELQQINATGFDN